MVNFGLVVVVAVLVVWVVLVIAFLAKWGNKNHWSGPLISVIAFAVLIAFLAVATRLGWMPSTGTFNNVPWPPR